MTSSELIDYDLVNFDNLLTSLLTIFQAITLEGWTKIMYNVSASCVTWLQLMDSEMKAFSGFYFTLFVLFGAFFVLNLILAVIMEAFSKIDEQIQREEEEKKRLALELAIHNVPKKENPLQGLRDIENRSEGQESDQRNEQLAEEFLAEN